MSDFACVVIIGRNEGERLKDCIRSVVGQTDGIVYVDSGSSDGSVEYARSRGVAVVELDLHFPFSAGRARNKGFWYLVEKVQDFQFVQFIDGDCQLCKGWLGSAKKHLVENPSCAIVAGRRAERFPEKSIYNRLCDIEWDTPIGEAESCGGDFMIRKDAFEKAGGFNPEVVAGEEPELCYRLRNQGWAIYRLDYSMTVHDADITRFSQWWMRAVRSGHAYAQGVKLHGREGRGYCVRDSLRIWFWAFIVPFLILFLALLRGPEFFLLAAVYIVQLFKISLSNNMRRGGWYHSFIFAAFNILGKWPQLFGQIKFLSDKTHRILEYK